MKRKKVKILNILTKLLLYFVSIFSVLSIVCIITSSMTGQSFLGSYFTWQIIAIASILLTVVYYLILKINKISSFLQILSIYFIFAFVTYLVCFLLRVFSIHTKQNLFFFLISVGITLVVFVILVVILLLKQRKENRKLNKYLDKFKERE